MTVPLNVDVGEASLEGAVVNPGAARGIVVFTHGSGSSKHSPQNRILAGKLRDEAIATVLFDLLCPEEEREDARTGRFRFKIDLLASRLVHVLTRVHLGQGTDGLPVGLCGSGRGAAVALTAAAQRPDLVCAVVSRSGRPELAGKALTRVAAPTLFMAGELDHHLLELNYGAAANIAAVSEVRPIPGATRESDWSDQVARQAGEWFAKYLERDAGPDLDPA